MASTTIDGIRNTTTEIYSVNDGWYFSDSSIINVSPAQVGIRVNSSATYSYLSLAGQINLATPADALASTVGVQNFADDTTIVLYFGLTVAVSNPDVEAHLVESYGPRATVQNHAFLDFGDLILNGIGSVFTNQGYVSGEVRIQAGGTITNEGPNARLGNITVMNPSDLKTDTTIINNADWRNDDGSCLQGSSSAENVYNYDIIADDINLEGGDDVFDSSNGLLLGTVNGGTGNDTFIVGWKFSIRWADRSLNYEIVEGENSGNDHIILTEEFLKYRKTRWDGGTTGAMPDNVENLTMLGAESGNAIGNALSNLLIGNAGANTLYGNSGYDTLRGGAGKDYLSGDIGNDHLFGGDGDDSIVAGRGNDQLWGGKGADTFWFDSNESGLGFGQDVIKDFDKPDRINLSSVDGIVSFNDLRKQHLFDSGDDVIIKSGRGSICIEDIHRSELNAGDFVF